MQNNVWNKATVYTSDDRVTFGGKNYVSLRAKNVNQAPDSSPSFWQLRRCDLKNNFESVYLRSRCFKKAIDNVPPEKIKALVEDVNFKKCTAKLARMAFVCNKDSLLMHGFDYDDMLRITTIFGITFLNSKFEAKTPKDFYYLMMRFVNQRLQAFFTFLSRKFDIRYKLKDQHLDAMPTIVSEHVTSISNQIGQDQLDEEPQEDYDVDTMVSNTMDAGRKKKVLELKERLKNELPMRVETLCYYSTSKHVGDDVRKKAQEYCRKFGIDYKGWATKHIKKHNFDDQEFILS